MPQNDIDYESLIDRSIKDFKPVKALWPVGIRLVFWIFLEAIVLTICADLSGFDRFPGLIPGPGALIVIGAFVLAGSAAGYFGLRSAIPAREIGSSELLIVIAGVCAAFAVTLFEYSATPLQILRTDFDWILQILGLTVLPWITIFWAVERGVPLQPARTGALIGIASFCFAISAQSIITLPNGFMAPFVSEAVLGILVAAASSLAGTVWLNPVMHWQQDVYLNKAQVKAGSLSIRPVMIPLTISVSIAMLIVVLGSARKSLSPIPDFDLAIEKYERSVKTFSPNVPSRDIAATVTAYVENGMPSYMWDFSREGFKFGGGRFERLPDGTPVTYTWFRGARKGVMCMFKQTDVFKAPPLIHDERRHMLFYQYRCFSVCLINVGGYGRFISVIVADMPMRHFMPLVLATL
jgi:hypothetical protein